MNKYNIGILYNIQCRCKYYRDFNIYHNYAHVKQFV